MNMIIPKKIRIDLKEVRKPYSQLQSISNTKILYINYP